MTREEKIAELINIRDNFNYTLAPREVFDDAIKALEQEPILDKLKAEIKKQQYGYMGGTDYEEGVRFGLMLAHQSLDKYKAETEAEDGKID